MKMDGILKEQLLLNELRSRGLTFAAAESCTGGLIAKRITDLSGASAVFRGGVVSYTNEALSSGGKAPFRPGAVAEPHPGGQVAVCAEHSGLFPALYHALLRYAAFFGRCLPSPDIKWVCCKKEIL